MRTQCSPTCELINSGGPYADIDPLALERTEFQLGEFETPEEVHVGIVQPVDGGVDAGLPCA